VAKAEFERLRIKGLQLISIPREIADVMKLFIEAGIVKSEGELAVQEVKRRILKYELMIRVFESSYKMSFQKFEEQDMVEKLGHTWNVERDYFDWELATTEPKSFKEILRRLTCG